MTHQSDVKCAHWLIDSFITPLWCRAPRVNYMYVLKSMTTTYVDKVVIKLV